jgi:hypothetical protein
MRLLKSEVPYFFGVNIPCFKELRDFVTPLFGYSGQSTAVITPHQVTVGLGRKQVNVVTAAKHHTVIATDAGELFTWGSNRGMFDSSLDAFQET